MNEWSPDGNYSCTGTLSQTGRSFRPLWDENEKGIRPFIVNSRALTENRSRSFQQYSMEDVSKVPLPSSNRSKKGGSGADPRFKRVIPLGVQNDVAVGTEAKSQKPVSSSQEKDTASRVSDSSFKELKSQPAVINLFKSSEQPKVKPVNNSDKQDNEKLPTTECSAVDDHHSNDNLKAVDKLSFNHDIVVKSLSKESLSDCTINTRNTSLISEEFADDLCCNDLKLMASSSRVRKVQNWIHDQTPKIEKKHSVITVIGQTQGTNSISSAFEEIDKRRKLVKELDKFAVCQKLLESDKENSDLLNNTNCSTTTEKFMFLDSVEPTNKCLPKVKSYGDKVTQHPEVTNNDNTISLSNGLSTDVVPLPVPRKRSSVKKKYKKLHSESECPFKGSIRLFFNSLQYQKIFCVLVVTSGVLCWFAFYSVQSTYMPFELFSPKPKPLTLYEKICQWLWEFFRPSANYQRTLTWRTY